MSGLVVHNWVQENRKYLPGDFIKNDSRRPEAIRQIGQLNEHAISSDGRVNTLARDQYFAKNSAKFSALNSNPAQPKIEAERAMPEVRQGYTRQPAVNPQRANTERTQPNVSRPKYNYNNIQRGQSYHTGGWEQAQPTYHPQPQRAPARQAPSAPARRSTSPAPARSVPSAPRSNNRGGGGIRR